MPPPKSLSSAQNAVMTGPGTPNSFSARSKIGAVSFQVGATGLLAAFGGELEIELDEGLREETLLAVARNARSFGRHAADGRFDRPWLNALGNGLALEVHDPALKGTVFWQLRLLAGGGGVFSALAVRPSLQARALRPRKCENCAHGNAFTR